MTIERGGGSRTLKSLRGDRVNFIVSQFPPLPTRFRNFEFHFKAKHFEMQRLLSEDIDKRLFLFTDEKDALKLFLMLVPQESYSRLT